MLKTLFLRQNMELSLSEQMAFVYIQMGFEQKGWEGGYSYLFYSFLTYNPNGLLIVVVYAQYKACVSFMLTMLFLRQSMDLSQNEPMACLHSYLVSSQKDEKMGTVTCFSFITQKGHLMWLYTLSTRHVCRPCSQRYS
jgi:hypothetical protein